MTLTHGSLFTGIGGIDLGFERAGIETIWQVEIDDYARRVLEKHWPGVERHADIRECGVHNLARPDIISGGFPCQDLSVAGKQQGLDAGRSGLWWEMLRVACELRPRILVVENVPNLLAGDGGEWARTFFASLAESGFDAEWGIVSAAQTGAPHLRKRVFVVAYAASERETAAQLAGQGGGSLQGGQDVADAASSRQASGRPGAGGPVRDEARRAEPERRSGEMADAEGESKRAGLCAGNAARNGYGRSRDGSCQAFPGCRRQGVRIGHFGLQVCEECYQYGSTAYGPFPNAPSAGLEGRWEGLFAARCQEWWSVEPDVGRVAHGVPARVDRLRCLGNAVVPQDAEWVGRRIVTSIEGKANGTKTEL